MKKDTNKTGKNGDILHEIQRVGAFVEHVDEKVTVMAEMLVDVKKTQDQHTEILEHHSQLLQRHSDMLEHHGEVLHEHSDILQEHSDILQEHSDDLKTIVKKLDNKVDRTEFEKRMKPLEHKVA